MRQSFSAARPTLRPERAWLGNFADEEQPSARLLLDGLDLVGQDRLQRDLTSLLVDLAATLQSPIALVPVRELHPGQSYFSLTNNDARAALLNANSYPGSEALVANIANSLRRATGNAGAFTASPSLRNMRDARCRTVLFVDDFSGSGDRIVKFDAAFRRHPTIRSWLSFGWIKIQVAVFATTTVARSRLETHFGRDSVHIHRMCPTFADRPWGMRERQAIEVLCHKYVTASAKGDALGYRRSRGLMAFAHSVPNNIPAILWQGGPRGRGWRSFFLNQSVPGDLLELFGDASPEERALDSLRSLRQQRLAEGGWRTAADGRIARVLLVLAALSRRPATIGRVMSQTGLARLEVLSIIAAARGWGLVGITLRLTDDGLRELAYAKGVTLKDEVILLHGSAEPYYPRSLRVGR